VSGARGWAYLGVFLGGAGSIAANVAAAFTPPGSVDPRTPVGKLTDAQLQVLAGQKAEPDMVGIIWGVAIAVGFFIVVQVLERTQWPQTSGRLDWAKRLGPAIVVAVGAGMWSYYHLVTLLLRSLHERNFITVALCFLGPLIVDGLMVVCSAALLIKTPAAAPAAAPAALPAASPLLPAATPGRSDRTAAAPTASATAVPAKPVTAVPAKPVTAVPAKPATAEVAAPPSPATRPGHRVADLPVDEQIAYAARHMAARHDWSIPRWMEDTGWSEGTARRRLASAKDSPATDGIDPLPDLENAYS